ncbi:MAG: basic amino acid ABC transporter substrate-binding protein [Spirochaetales bacterium]|nr:basic amino acid ABC transporter substrate-binding protein [Spirochaetales bacterium]
MKKIIFILFTITLFVSCSKSDNSNKIVMGTNAAFPPFEYIGGNNGDDVIGFDVEIAKEIAKDLGKKLEIADMEFDTLLTALNAKKVDFVIAGMTINEKRKESVNFSDPYYEATQAVIVKADSLLITNKNDIKDKKIAVQLGTTGNSVAEDFTTNVTAFQTGFEAILELKNGKVDAVIIDEQPAIAFLKKNPDLKIIEMNFDPEFYGIAATKDNIELIKSINKTLERLKSDGTYDRLMSEYMK